MPPDLSQKLSYPYTQGLYLAVNAVPDAYLVMDGPGCAFYRAMTVHGRHDWASTLLSCDGNHRVQYAGVDANSIASNYEDRLRQAVRGAAGLPQAGVVLLSSMPICTLAGTQHERILREERGAKPAAFIEGRSLAGNWLEGYEAALSALVSALDFSGGKPGRGNVAIVGHLMDRCEGDGRGDAAELRRLTAGLGLEAVSVWLSGEPTSRLRDARHARTILSLPHGRKAAAALARKLGARLVELGVPLGLEGTQDWLRKLGAALGRERAAEAFIRAELGRIVPRLEWAVPASFLDKKAVFVGEPALLPGMAGLCEGLGMELAACFLNGAGKDAGGAFFEPSMSRMRSEWGRLDKDMDLFIGNTDAYSMLRPSCAFVELGFPSVGTHFLRDEPCLGFEGFLHLADRMANAMSEREAMAP